MKKFAKLFEDTPRGQILMMLGTSDKEKPEVRLYFQPEGLGTCSLALGFEDTDKGWDKAELAFDTMDQDMALEMVNQVHDEYVPTASNLVIDK